MAFIEQANPKVASLASQGLFDPASLTPDDVRAICATALARVPDHRQNEIVQARPFYERLGYSVFTVIDDYPPGHRRFLMAKSFAENRS